MKKEVEKTKEEHVTPWSVEGAIDYERLIQQFGTQKLSPEIKKELSENILVRRGFYYSHRNFDKAFREQKEGKSFFLYTGRAPSGPMHIGHLFSFMITKFLQDKYDVNVYIQIPDEEKFFVKQDLSLKDVDHWVDDNMREIIALGFDPDKTFIFTNREYVRHMYTKACEIAKKINLSKAKAVFGFDNQTNIGLIFYPAMQMVPTFFEKGMCVIPAGIDQDPYWRIQRDLAESIGGRKASQLHSKFFPPLQGVDGKMSTRGNSDGTLFLSDTADIVKKKINKFAFSGGQATLEEHRKKGGNTSIDVSFQWLSIFFEQDDKKLEKMKKEYESGKMTSGELKGVLIEKLNSFLKHHQEEKEKAKSKIQTFMHTGKLAKEMWNKNF